MTIAIYADKNYEGASKQLREDAESLKGTPHDKPSSLEITSRLQALLLFKNTGWSGRVHYIRGSADVPDLGSGRHGKNGFGNSVRSIRITPFSVDLNITVVRNGDDYPGDWTSKKDAEDFIRPMIDRVNNFLYGQQALLQLNIARIEARDSESKFVVNVQTDYPASWKERGEIDVIFVDRFSSKKDNVLGCARRPGGGKVIVLPAKSNPDSGPDGLLTKEKDPDTGEARVTTSKLAFIAAHELGHYLGLSHRTADGDTSNLMYESVSGFEEELSQKSLELDQIREMHQRLATNIARKGDRN